MITVAKYIKTGLACSGLIRVVAGIGLIFSALICVLSLS